MKCSGDNVILRGIVHVVSGFPLHFMFYRENLDCFSSRVLLQEFNTVLRPENLRMSHYRQGASTFCILASQLSLNTLSHCPSVDATFKNCRTPSSGFKAYTAIRYNSNYMYNSGTRRYLVLTFIAKHI